MCYFYRNVLQIGDADSTESTPDTASPVVIDMPEHNPGDLGGTMRLGKRVTILENYDRFSNYYSVISKLT